MNILLVWGGLPGVVSEKEQGQQVTEAFLWGSLGADAQSFTELEENGFFAVDSFNFVIFVMFFYCKSAFVFQVKTSIPLALSAEGNKVV